MKKKIILLQIEVQKCSSSNRTCYIVVHLFNNFESHAQSLNLKNYSEGISVYLFIFKYT